MAQAAEKVTVAPSAVGKDLAQIAVVFAVQFAAGKLGDVLAVINSGGIGPVWPASGIALAALLLFGYQVWPGVAAGAFLLAFLSPIPHIAAVVYAAGTTLAALTGTCLLRRVVNFCASLSRLRDTLGLIVFGAFGSSIVSASIGVSLLYGAHLRGWSGFGSASLIYWLGDSMGVLLVTPLVLTFPNLLRIRPWVRVAEFAALLLLLTVACFIVFGDLPLIPVRLHVLAFAVLPFIIWAAIRFGMIGATLSTLFVAAIATTETAVGSGPFAHNTPFTNAVLLDVFFAVLSLSGMTLAAVIAEREQAEREREQLVREQAAMEGRLRLATIVESSDDAIIGKDMDGIITDWNKGAEQLYGYSAGEVIGKQISLLVPPDHSDDFADIAGKHDFINHYETVHQRKDDKRIEVSMTMSPIRDTEGRIVGASVIVRDMSERKRREAILRESEERFRLAAQAGRMFAYEWDAATDVIVRSPESTQILGIDEATQVTGQQILTKVHPDDREGLKAAVAALSPEKPDLLISYRMVRPDNTVIWVERNSRAHFNEQGRLLRIVGMVADITERKQAEEALKRSELNYRLFVAQSSEGIFCQELERPIPVDLPEDEQVQRILHESYMAECNEALARMYGMSAADFVGKRLTETLDAENPVNIELTRDYIRGGYRVVDRESHEVDPQGNLKVFLNSMIGIVENGMLLRTWGIQRDITDRRQAEQARAHAEQALRASEQRFRLATQAGKMYAYEWDVATDMVVRSDEYVNVLGFDDQPKQLTRQQLLARVHADDRALFATSVDQLIPENPTTQIRYRVLRPDGSVVWLEKSARAFFDEQGRMVSVTGMVADITERKRAEEALRESEDKLRLLLDSTAEAIYGIDLKGRCTFCNPACLRAVGYERVDELLGKNMHHLIHHARADGSLFPVEECRIFRAFRTGEGVHVDDEVLWRADGTSFPAEYWSYPQRREQEVVGAVVAFIDITQRKLAEEAFASVNRRLIEAQEQERIRIARELHDDIGQRLALLAIELEQLHLSSADLPPEVHSHTGGLLKRTIEIATDVQSLSHELHSSKLQHLGIAAAIRGFCKEFGERHNVEIDFQTHDLPSPLPPDASLCFFRVLQEALHNSAKHSGVRHFEVLLWGASGEIHLTVSDSGAGFDSEVTKEARGLGLISMEERLKALNGTFSIESQPKRGTTIHARVPLRSDSRPVRAAG
jgi:PAS domain S-box-containing protein